MPKTQTYDIDIKEAAESSNEISYILDDDYFKSLEDAQIQHGKVNAAMLIRKVSDGEFTLTMSIEGSVTVQCDRCLDDMQQPVKGESSYIVKFGETPDITDDVIIVDENKGILDTAWLIYEAIALAVPIKHVHAPGKCNDAMTRKLEELSATRSGDETAEDTTPDPRWAALGKLNLTTD